MKICEICGKTDNETRIIKSKKFGKVLCRRHNLQLTKHGKILNRTIYEPNKLIIRNYEAFIQLYDKKGNCNGETQICISSISKCKPIKWYKRSNGYVFGSVNGVKIQLHRFLLNCSNKSIEIDHIDGNPLNNTLGNLREATHAENLRNIHKEKTVGVNYNKYNGRYRWIPRLMIDGKSIWLGTYDTEAEATFIRKEAELKYFGEFAPK